jgi:hypothetical protein
LVDEISKPNLIDFKIACLFRRANMIFGHGDVEVLHGKVHMSSGCAKPPTCTPCKKVPKHPAERFPPTTPSQHQDCAYEEKESYGEKFLVLMPSTVNETLITNPGTT